MVRTQIYLTEAERAALKAIARQTGKKQSELIRQAIDLLIEGFQAWRAPDAAADGPGHVAGEGRPARFQNSAA